MAIFSHNSNNFILSLKLVLISIAVLFMAVMLKRSVPVVTDFALSEVPSIWSVVASWLKPPYLYLVINCIIITIVASSRLQSNFDHDHSFPPPPPESVLLVQPEPVKVPADVRTDYVVAYGGDVLKSELVDVTPVPEFEYGYDPKVVKVSEFDVYGNVDARVSEAKTTITVNASEEAMNGGDHDFVISKSSWNALNKEPTEVSFLTEKPPVSARFGQRKVVKATPEGGKTLRVSKPKRHDTLESTWKTITDGRPMPLTRHLKKLDTWETHGRHHLGSGGEPQDQHGQKMTKSETFNISGNKPSLSRSTGSGKLRKDPSLSQDELNKRVEAFIKKFNEDMRLQRQESLNQYMEMINRGAH